VRRRVRANAALQLVPIIFVSRRSDVEERVRACSGRERHLAKPFDPPELVARVGSTCPASRRCARWPSATA